MNAEFDHALDAYADEEQRMQTSLYELNARIARLAIALGLQLHHPQDVEQLFQDAAPWSGPHEGSAWHEAQARSELRALLVMRYDKERQMVHDLGVPITQKILEDVELHLLCAGFAKGADGIALDGVINPQSLEKPCPCPKAPS